MADAPKNPNSVPPIPPDHQLAKVSDSPKPVQPLPGGHGPAHEEEGVPKDLKQPSNMAIALVVGIFVLLMLAIGVVGWVPDYREKKQTRDDAIKEQEAKPVALWTTPDASTGESEVTLPCDLSAYQQTALYTRANGYLAALRGPNDTKDIDIGSKVKEGDILAVISTPDVDAQLAQSKATLEQNKANVVKAQADLNLAKVTLDRYLDSEKTSPGSVTKEQIDQEKGAYEDAEAGLKQVQASVAQAEASVQQLEVTVGFEKIIAPFSGTITARNFFKGALLLPTQVGPGQEIFDIQETDKLRVYVNVPQGYANNIKIGQMAKLAIRNFPGKDILGTVALTAGALDPNTRTLKVQVDFDNKDGKLFAGEYGELKLPVTAQIPVMRIPSSALIFDDKGLTVKVVDEQNKIHVKHVKVGRDFGVDLEITEGLDLTDHIVLNPGERFAEGVVVDPKMQPKAAKPAPTPAEMPVTTQPTGDSPSPSTTQPMAIGGAAVNPK